MDEAIRARILTAVVVTALCCTGLGLRVALQKAGIAPGDAARPASDTQETSAEHGFSARRLLIILDFRRLSASSQRTLSLILLIPAGTLVTAAYRRFTGFRTMGTFSPTLLALSQTKSDWKIGLPGIFNWVIEGLKSLTKAGRFTMPQKCKDATAETSTPPGRSCWTTTSPVSNTTACRHRRFTTAMSSGAATTATAP